MKTPEEKVADLAIALVGAAARSTINMCLVVEACHIASRWVYNHSGDDKPDVSIVDTVRVVTERLGLVDDI
jgi:hypothetical protein